MAVLRTDRALGALMLPRIEAIESPLFQPGDVLVVSGGFEERATASLKAACNINASGISVIAFEYKPTLQQNRCEEISALCKERNWQYSCLTYDRCSPNGAYEQLSRLLPNNAARVFVDISGMSRLLIVQLIAGLICDRQRKHASVLYAEARYYPPSEEYARLEIEKNKLDSETLLSFVSSGVFDLAVVPELSSINPQRAPTRLIAFPSFNSAQLLNVRSNIQPSQMSLIHGTPPDPSMRWRPNVIAELNHLDADVARQDLWTSTLDYSETLRVLLELYEQWAAYNSLIISPTGSKMQTVAVGIFRAVIRDVQIIYPTPLRFVDPSAHTLGVKQLYELRLDRLVKFANEIAEQP